MEEAALLLGIIKCLYERSERPNGICKKRAAKKTTLYALHHQAQSFPFLEPSYFMPMTETFQEALPIPRRCLLLELALEQIGNHLATGDTGRRPQGGEVEGAGQTVGEAKEEHGRDPAAGVLERKAALVHLVLLDVAAVQVVDGALGVDLGLVLAGDVGELGAVEDVEVVVGGVAARVALGSDGGAEDDEVLGDA